MPPFVIQQHCRDQQVHWDLMLDQGDCLATWQISEPPERWPGAAIRCQKLADHRRIYLSYEGPVSKNRGSVTIVDKGGYIPMNITSEQWKLELRGDMMQGVLELKRIENDHWQLIFQSGSNDDQGDDQ